jgi:hypothetical protein
MRLLTILLSVLALSGTFVPTPLFAAAAPKSQACTAASAAEARIDIVQRKLDIWLGRCVHLRGIAAGGRLFAGRAALADPLRPNQDVPTSSIALYPVTGVAPPRKAAWVELTGRIGSCAMAHDMVERLSAEEPGQIIMVSGFCHTSTEAYVEPSSIRPEPQSEVDRLTEAELPEAKRQLVAVAETGPGLKPYVAAAKAFVAAVAGGDEAGFRRLVAPMSQYELDQLGGAPQPDWLRDDLASAHKAFAAVRRDNGYATLGEAKLFRERNQVGETKPSGLVVCFCRTAHCAGRWPVTPFDADRDPARPYLCIGTQTYLLGPGRPAVVAVEMDRPSLGFREPRWDAHERSASSR